MFVGFSSSALTVAFGFPLMKGSIRMLVEPSVSSNAEWPRKRMSMSVLRRGFCELPGKLIPHRDADQHAHARLLGDQRADSRKARVGVGGPGGGEDLRLVGGV